MPLPPTKPGSPQTVRPQLYRHETQVVVPTASDVRLLGENPRRNAVCFGTPVGTSSGGGSVPTNGSVSGHSISTAAIGPALSYTCPVGTSALVTMVQYALLGGTAPQLRLLYTPNGGSQQFLGPVLTNGTINQVNAYLGAGDNITLQTSTAGAGSTVDAEVYVQQFPAAGGGGTDNTVFISLDGPATVNAGMPLHPGAPPFLILYDHIGQALREEIRAIAGNAPVTLTVWDIFEVGCPCIGE